VFSQIKSTVKENHFLFIGDSIPAQLVRSKALFHKIERQFDPYTCDQSDLKDYRIWKNLGPNPYDMLLIFLLSHFNSNSVTESNPYSYNFYLCILCMQNSS
jgi:hypothetical protein